MLEDPLTCFSEIQNRYLEIAQEHCKRDLQQSEGIFFLNELLKPQYNKATSLTRDFVKEFITPIVLKNHMEVRKEAIGDYVVYNKSDDVLGIVEAKAGRCLTTASVIECMETLSHLRKKVPGSLFGVTTDAVHYVFVVLTTDGVFWLEHQNNLQHQNNVEGVLCHEVNTWHDLHTMAAIFNSLLQTEEW